MAPLKYRINQLTYAVREVRLVGGKHRAEGRVEVSWNGEWATVCDDFWDDRDATVVCQMLGYLGQGKAKSQAHFGAGQGKIALDNVECTGSEKNIFLCKHTGLGKHDCKHSEDAGVICSGKLQFHTNSTVPSQTELSHRMRSR